jgi:hypothetical protein
MDLVKPLHAQLARLGESLSSLGADAGLFGGYLRLEMMDMDFLPYPELAARLEEKYRTLAEWVARLRAALKAI